MNLPPSVQRDERTLTVENAGYRWAYLFLSFGLLFLVIIRSFVYREGPWDLLLLVILGGVVGSAYQARHRVLSRQWAVVTLFAAILAGIVAGTIVWFVR